MGINLVWFACWKLTGSTQLRRSTRLRAKAAPESCNQSKLLLVWLEPHPHYCQQHNKLSLCDCHALLSFSSSVMSVESTSQTSKPSLSSFRFRIKTLARGDIEIDEITRHDLPAGLYETVEEMTNFSGTVPAGTPMVSKEPHLHLVLLT